MRLENLGLIGNCQFSALVHRGGDVVWCCLPRFDSEPVFSTLLDAEDGGRFRIGPPGGESGSQRYIPSTNILETIFHTSTGSFRVIDFAPRFMHLGTTFRPTQMIRIVEPIEGTPRVQVKCEPKLGWSKARPSSSQGSHHVNFEGFGCPSAAYDGFTALLFKRAAVQLDRSSTSGAQLGRIGRGTIGGIFRAHVE